MRKRDFLHSLRRALRAVVRGGAAVCCCGAAAMLSACASDDTYSDFHCNLYIDNSTHLDATLSSALNPLSPGVFCRISYDAASRSYAFVSNQGQSSKSVFDAEDTRRGNSGRIGMNNGLIVGYGNLSSDLSGGYVLYAYDAQCPNCFDYTAIPVRNYQLTMTTAGMAVCANCKRQYNMNTGGNCTNDSGKGLTQYRTTATPKGASYTLFIN